MENLKIRGRIWLETESGLKIGVGRARLLEQIHLLGSIAEAAKILKKAGAQNVYFLTISIGQGI